jgi:PAS domain-containing protein
MAGEIDQYFMEKRYIRKDGAVIWTSLAVAAVRNPDRTVAYFLTVISNITERKHAEQSLRESEQRFRQLAENINEVLAPDNRAALTATLENLRKVTASLDKSLLAFNAAAGAVGQAGSGVAQLTVQTERSLQELNQTAHALEQNAARLSRRAEQAADATDDQLTLAVSDLRTSIAVFNRSVEKWRDPRTTLLGPTAAQLGPGEKVP